MSFKHTNSYLPFREVIQAIDEPCFTELEQFHSTKTSEELRQLLLSNEPGPVTATYYLILESKFNTEDLPSPKRFTRDSTADVRKRDSTLFLFFSSYYND
jgi:hypothetical protein